MKKTVYTYNTKSQYGVIFAWYATDKKLLIEHREKRLDDGFMCTQIEPHYHKNEPFEGVQWKELFIRDTHYIYETRL